jgi:hypothetical protein
MNKSGRPTLFSQELADSICEQLALGYSMRTVCAENNMPAMSSVFKWLRENKQFSEQYARAKQESADAMAEDILDIADDGTNDWMEVERKDGSTYKIPDKEVLARSRLRVDTRKWLMAKMKPKVYGDRLDMTTNGKDLPTPILGGLSQHDKPRDDGIDIITG